MQPTSHIWFNGKLIPWDDAKTHVLAHTLHYGAGAFEGIRVYKTDRGPAIFRLDEHLERLFYSCGVLKIEIPFTKAQLHEAVLETLRKVGLEQGYIRPLVYLGYGIMGINPKGAPTDVAIAAWPWGKYLGADAVDVKVSSFIRIHSRSTVADAKICGHYVNSILAVNELRGSKYHEALFLDSEGNVAEGPGENFFMVKGGVLVTPPLGAILAGITRDTILQLCKVEGIAVKESTISLTEACRADEAFFTGTAAEVTPIRSINDTALGDGAVGPITARLRSRYSDVVYGRDRQFDRFLTLV